MPLKAQWYEMIESGVKTEEYREIKPYWNQRLLMYGNAWGDKGLVVNTYNKAVVFGSSPNEVLQKLYNWCVENKFI